MRIADLFIYPLKSARGIALPSSEIDAFGLPGDRRAIICLSPPMVRWS
ncbi:hypothetical protein SAMN05216228_1004158 [Rhizobium tibeticum]|uniref:Putative Fe-S protein n=1 Tax=Rhizobium tibeticum TaxID=501024 RepID=A0A1H8GA54_9HYPH|nr:putative Fe-S protein [Rhizobium tibeticum]SEN40645.1 hypothetical protein SAMN05216228_1004158 [Rhizobium tibeticum]